MVQFVCQPGLSVRRWHVSDRNDVLTWAVCQGRRLVPLEKPSIARVKQRSLCSIYANLGSSDKKCMLRTFMSCYLPSSEQEIVIHGCRHGTVLLAIVDNALSVPAAVYALTAKYQVPAVRLSTV